MRGNFDTALKVGRPVARQAVDQAKAYVASECPLAAEHIVQGMALLGGVEETAFLSVAGEAIMAVPEADQERGTPGGKASSVQFVHFPFTEARVARFRTPDTPVVLGFEHPAYAHQAVMPEEVRAALAEDFD